MKKRLYKGFVLAASILSAILLIACGADENGGSSGCPDATADSVLWLDETAGFCLLYPSGHVVEQPDGGGTEIVVGSVMNHTDPRISIHTEDLAGRNLDQVVKEFLAGYDGFAIAQMPLTLGGEQAILLDGIPGQDYYRKVYVTHDDLLLAISIFPYDPNLTDSYHRAENLYALVVDSLRFGAP